MFSNAWVHQTVESICLALMIDPQGDPDIVAAQTKLRETLDDWIPKILAAQHPDGYLQTAFTLRDVAAGGPSRPAGRGPWTERWSPAARAEPRRLRRRLLHRVGHQPLHDDGGQGPPAVQRGEEAVRLLGGPHRPARRSRSGSTGTRRWSRRSCGSAASSTRSRHAGTQAGRATATSRSRSSCSTAARTAPSTTRATCRCSSSTRPSATRSARSTRTPAWRTSPSRRTTWTTRAPSSRSGTTSSTRSTT